MSEEAGFKNDLFKEKTCKKIQTKKKSLLSFFLFFFKRKTNTVSRLFLYFCLITQHKTNNNGLSDDLSVAASCDGTDQRAATETETKATATATETVAADGGDDEDDDDVVVLVETSSSSSSSISPPPPRLPPPASRIKQRIRRQRRRKVLFFFVSGAAAARPRHFQQRGAHRRGALIFFFLRKSVLFSPLFFTEILMKKTQTKQATANRDAWLRVRCRWRGHSRRRRPFVPAQAPRQRRRQWRRRRDPRPAVPARRPPSGGLRVGITVLAVADLARLARRRGSRGDPLFFFFDI